MSFGRLHCVRCRAPVGEVVIRFCNDLSKFGGKIYCIGCQGRFDGTPAVRPVESAQNPPVGES